MASDFFSLPKAAGLNAEFWNDADDHSQGTFEQNVHLVRAVDDGFGRPYLQAVDAKINHVPTDMNGETRHQFAFKDLAAYNNFKCFS